VVCLFCFWGVLADGFSGCVRFFSGVRFIWVLDGFEVGPLVIVDSFLVCCLLFFRFFVFGLVGVAFLIVWVLAW